jgi:galactofuranose transport system permease protein
MNATVKTYAIRLFPQIAALAIILLMVSIAFPGFFRLEMQNGRLYGSVIDILNRGAPVALLAIGMTIVIATKGIDLSVGAIMAICGAVAAACITEGYGLVATLTITIGTGLLCGLWNGVLVAVLDIQPIIATLVLMVAGRGIAQLITEGAILTFNDAGLIFIGSGSFLGRSSSGSSSALPWPCSCAARRSACSSRRSASTGAPPRSRASPPACC